MGRKKLYDFKRSIMLGVKVTPSFRTKLEDLARNEGMTVSTFILRVLEWFVDGPKLNGSEAE